MFTFAYPHYLWALLAVPLLVTLYFWARWIRARRLRQFGPQALPAGMAPEVSAYKPPLKLTLSMLALAFAILALARPWGGVNNQETAKEGIEVIIAVDASNSMLASSTGEQGAPSRMRAAKLALEKLINRLDNDRVGLIVYAGDAYTLIPVTNDFVSAKMFLNSIDPSMVPHQGTNIAAAIDLASKSFSKSRDIGKAIILITDAEELENEEEVMKTVTTAAKNKIQVDVVGIGSQTPVEILEEGSPLVDPETGMPVKTSLNEDLALRIAKAGQGIYVNTADRDAISELEKQLDRQNKTALEQSFSVVHDELYATFAWIAFALLLLDLFISESRNSWLDRFTFFKKEEK